MIFQTNRFLVKRIMICSDEYVNCSDKLGFVRSNYVFVRTNRICFFGQIRFVRRIHSFNEIEIEREGWPLSPIRRGEV